MKELISYQPLKEKNILIRCIHEVGSLDHIISTWESDIERGLVHANLVGVITLLEEPDDCFSIDHYKELERFYKKYYHIFGKVKMAQVIATPVIAFAKIFEEYNPEFKTQAFSTIDAAIEWMEL